VLAAPRGDAPSKLNSVCGRSVPFRRSPPLAGRY
jgi:hypothetical protein